LLKPGRVFSVYVNPGKKNISIIVKYRPGILEKSRKLGLPSKKVIF